MDKDHYRTLGVARGASQQEIKRAYRRLARRYHPDVSSEAGAEERFKEVGEAYEVLSDTEKRSAYDAMGRQWRTGRHFRSAPAGGVGGFGFGRARAEGGVRDFGDFFESLFRGSFHTDRDRPYRTRGEDVEVELTLTLEEAFSGVTKTLMLKRPAPPSGIRLRSSRRVRVRVPPGVTDGQRLKLPGQGGAGAATAGDLYATVSLAPHPYFRVLGRDIHLDLPLTPWEAALGAIVQAPTLGGMVELRIPKGAEPGRKLRLRGRGLPGEPSGDQLVQLRIMAPPATTPEAEALYRRLAETLRHDPRAHFRAGRPASTSTS
jgi:curved DNA-binding protein